MNDTYPDFLAAAVGWLRGNASLVEAFGEDTSSQATTKFWADHAEGQPDLPYLVFEEVDDVLTYETPDEDGLPSSDSEGHIEVHIYAATKLQARKLGAQVAVMLWDAPLTFEDGALIQLRPTGQWFEDSPQVSIGTPVEYHRIVEFRYLISRT